MNRWAEYKAGTLTSPVVVQHALACLALLAVIVFWALVISPVEGIG